MTSMKRIQERLFYLDVIRMASAILIVIYHFSLPFTLSFGGRSVDILHATVNGSWGMTPVYCFFMVSGTSLMHRYEKEDRLDIPGFYKKRFLSIYPLFWIAYALGFLAVFWQLKGLYDVPTWSIVWSVLGIDGWIVNWVPTFYMVGEWFLGSIILLYLLFPAVRFLWKKAPGRTMLLITIAAGALFWYHPFPMDIKQDPVIDLFYFLLGAGIERCRRQIALHAGRSSSPSADSDKAGPADISPRRGTDPGKLRFLLWAGSVCILAVWAFVPLTDQLPAMELTVSAQAWGLPMFLRQSFILLGACAFYLFLMGLSGWLERCLPIKKLVLEISRRSYGIFLTHHMVSQILCGHFAGTDLSPREVLVLLALVFFATWCMTLLIDRIWAYIKERIWGHTSFV